VGKFCEEIEDEKLNFAFNSDFSGELVMTVKHRLGISVQMSYIHP